jgi:hypothetical protein
MFGEKFLQDRRPEREGIDGVDQEMPVREGRQHVKFGAAAGVAE